MVTRGSKKKTDALVHSSEQLDAESQTAGRGMDSGEGGPATSPIGRRGADILAEVVEDLVMDDAGNLRERAIQTAPPARAS